MLKQIKAFLTANIFLTKGQIVSLGELYMLEEEVSELRAKVRGHKAAFTRQDKKCADCEIMKVNAALQERLANEERLT
jgi:hypothetical protein